jgi:hypothetical protein
MGRCAQASWSSRRAGTRGLLPDKRSVGVSEGDCCTSRGHYNFVAADADGAVAALRSRADVDAARMGFYGTSEAGWVVPLADARLERRRTLRRNRDSVRGRARATLAQ